MNGIVWDIDTIFRIILIIVFIACGIVLLLKARSLEMLEQRRFLLGLCAFSIGWSIMNTIFLFAETYPDTDPLYSTLWKIATIVGISALFSVIIVVEKYTVPKTKFFFSIITIIGLALVIILPIQGTEITGARLAAYIFLPVAAASIFILYLYLIIKLSGKPRQEAVIVFLGMFLIVIGYLLDTELLKSLLPPAFIILDSILMICGGITITLIYYRRE